jgi:hypothetical protein
LFAEVANPQCLFIGGFLLKHKHMKDLINGLYLFIISVIISLIILPIGVIYTLGYMLWYFITFDTCAFFIRFLEFINGLLATIGYAFRSLAVILDMLWNITGEWMEDIVTADDNSGFARKGKRTVSATLGELARQGKLNSKGIWFCKVLNKFFRQCDHCGGAYEFELKQNELEETLFKKC